MARGFIFVMIGADICRHRHPVRCHIADVSWQMTDSMCHKTKILDEKFRFVTFQMTDDRRWMFDVRVVKTQEAETSPTCLSGQINRLMKFQLPRSRSQCLFSWSQVMKIITMAQTPTYLEPISRNAYHGPKHLLSHRQAVDILSTYHCV